MCQYPNYGIRVLDKRDGTISVRFVGRYLGSLASDKIGAGIGQYVIIPCGQCKECRIAKAREWSVRLLHEAALHDHSCFLTLTYDDDHLPDDSALHPEDMQKFLKDLRRYLDYHYGKKIRFYGVGEYGSKFRRPHFHLIIFGEDFNFDKKLFKTSKNGFRYYVSDTVKQLWKNGFHLIGDVSYDSVFYCARYVTKKITGDLAEYYYDGMQPEFARMSRRPGIGHDFVLKYTGDIYNYDKILLRNLKCNPPSYYDKIFSDLHPDEFCKLKDIRAVRSEDFRNKLKERFVTPADELAYFDALKVKSEELINRKVGHESL